MPRHRVALAPVLFIFLAASTAHASAIWKPVTADELRLTADAIPEPDADAAVLFREGELNDNDPEGTTLSVYIRIKIFSERGRRYADVRLPYHVELGRITDVHARTIRPDGSTVEVEGRDVFDILVVKTSHGLWRAKTFTLPAVVPGAIIEYRYRNTYPLGFRYFALDLQSELFTQHLRYSIQPQSDSRFNVRWVVFNAPDPKRFTPVWAGAFKISADNIHPFHREPFMAPEPSVKMWGWLYYADATEKDPDKYWRRYARNMQFRTNYETRPTRAVRRLVDSTVASSDDAGEKLARIYNYIQSEIQNIGFKPELDAEDEDLREAKKTGAVEQTLRRRYGNPREINRLFIAMLRAAGLDARVAELTTRDDNFFHRSFPDSLQFNSEVAAVVAHDGSVRFFDPGTEHCPLGMLAWEKEATTALVVGVRGPRFETTPVTDAGQSCDDRTISATISAEGRVDARVEVKLSGHRALDLRNQIAELNPDDRVKKIGAMLRDVLPAATMADGAAQFFGAPGQTDPRFSFAFSAPDFASRTGRRLLIRPALLSRRDESLTPDATRANSLYFHYPWSQTEHVVIEPPAGFEVEQLPGAIDFDIGAAQYHAEFRREGKYVVYDRRLIVNAIIFAVDQYKTVKAFFDRVREADMTAASLAASNR